MSLFRGSGVALVTPFRGEEINYDELEGLIEWQIEQKTDAIIVCGTTGESATLSIEEKKSVIAFTVEKVNKRIPVIAGTGGNDTRASIELSIYAQNVGVDGLLIVTPYYNKATQKGLVEHFSAIADAVTVPIILYNVPGRTGVSISPETVAILAEKGNIMGIKEASGDLSHVAKIAKLCPTTFAIYSGNDDQILPVLSLGGVGVISVVANVMPFETHQMIMLYMQGQFKEALKLQLNMLPFINALFIEVNPIPVKAALTMLGKITGELRLPLTNMESHNSAILESEMINLGLIRGRFS